MSRFLLVITLRAYEIKFRFFSLRYSFSALDPIVIQDGYIKRPKAEI